MPRRAAAAPGNVTAVADRLLTVVAAATVLTLAAVLASPAPLLGNYLILEGRSVRGEDLEH